MDGLDKMICVICLGGTMTILLLGGVLVYTELENVEYRADYGLGSVVTTTAEYEHLTNDSFTGVVVRGETWDDPALTLRNRNGVERRIATEFLEPMR